MKPTKRPQNLLDKLRGKLSSNNSKITLNIAKYRGGSEEVSIINKKGEFQLQTPKARYDIKNRNGAITLRLTSGSRSYYGWGFLNNEQNIINSINNALDSNIKIPKGRNGKEIVSRLNEMTTALSESSYEIKPSISDAERVAGRMTPPKHYYKALFECIKDENIVKNPSPNLIPHRMRTAQGETSGFIFTIRNDRQHRDESFFIGVQDDQIIFTKELNRKMHVIDPQSNDYSTAIIEAARLLGVYGDFSINLSGYRQEFAKEYQDMEEEQKKAANQKFFGGVAPSSSPILKSTMNFGEDIDRFKQALDSKGLTSEILAESLFFDAFNSTKDYYSDFTKEYAIANLSHVSLPNNQIPDRRILFFKNTVISKCRGIGIPVDVHAENIFTPNVIQSCQRMTIEPDYKRNLDEAKAVIASVKNSISRNR